MSCKINFGVELNSLSFCGPDNIAGLSKSNLIMASSSTGTVFSTIEMDKFSTDIFGCYDEMFIANKKIGIQSLDLETSKLLPIYLLNKKNREELSCSYFNPISENMLTAVWCPDTRVTRLSKIDTRSPQGSHDLITFNRTSVSKIITIGDHGIVLEQRDGLVQLFDLRQSNRVRWSYNAKETCASIQEAGEAICLQTKSGIAVLNELSGKESFSFKMRENHEFCGSLHGLDDEEMFLVARTLNRSSMRIIGAREYAGGKGKPILRYYGNSRSITHFVRFQRDLFATADESGRVVVQYGDTRTSDFKTAAQQLYKSNQYKWKTEKSDKNLKGALQEAKRHEDKYKEEMKKENEEEKVESDSKIENYEYIKDLGRGGFGNVAAYKCKRSGLFVAIKILDRSRRMDEQFIANREALNMKKVSHKNLIPIYDYFKSPDRVYLVMEMMSTTLAAVIESTGIIEEYDASRIMKEIGDGLAYCHRKKLIHRDCKPENILISERDLKLGDFGVSTFEEGQTLCGTLAFMAPEMFLEEPYSFEVDSWAMGCVLYEMLTAKRAFKGPVGKGEKKRDGWKVDTKLFSQDISEVLNGLLQVKPKSRWSMQQLLSSNWIFAQDEKKEDEITESIKCRMGCN